MRKKNVICAMLILIFTAGIALGAWQIYQQLHEYSEGADSYTDLEEYVKVPEAPDDDMEEIPVSSESGETESARWWPEVDFEALREINPDLVGWIYIEGTEISYPVVQGADNQFYLKHLFTGEWNSSGGIFLDARNSADLSDRNSILYGHHMKDGSMFHSLMEYKSQEYYDEHPTVLFLTPEANYEVKIFAGYVASVDADAWTVGFSSDSEFEEWLRRAKERSCFTSEITPAATDRILTLSTCSYEFNDARFVLLGVLE